MSRFFILLMIVVLIVFNGYRNPAIGHPHNWISLDSSFVVDSQNRLIAIEQRWEFDAFYSEITLANLLSQYGDETTGLRLTAARFSKNLRGVQYFSTLQVDEKSIPLPKPDQAQLKRVSRNGQSILALKMRFTMKSPIELKKRTLKWWVYDPTHYIAMAHNTIENAKIIGPNAAHCVKQLIEPDPSTELILYAQGLDRNEKGFDGLGTHFAQELRIRC